MPVQYEIRRAVLGDLERILQIENASFGPEAYDRKLFASYLRKCGELFLVLEHRGKVCGYIITCLRGTSSPLRAELVSVAVDPARRGKGAASVLLESTLRRLRRRRVAQLQLVVRVTNRPALAFYEKYGFEPKRRVPRYYEDGGDGIAMMRPVTPP
jgi:ribosomal-protein-alanine N-acetyltransferase